MQYSFEFDAPRYCFLETPLQKKQSSDYFVSNYDHNDFWFMHTCEKSSPLNSFDQNTKSLRQELPVQRRSIYHQRTQIMEATLELPRIIQNQENFQKNVGNQVQVLITEQVQIKQKMQPQARRTGFRKTLIQKQKQKISSKHHSADKQQKPAHNNKMPTRSKSNLHKNSINDIRPCPLPPRIQREWQNKFEKKWYNLSPASKLQAQKQMKEIQAEKNKEKSNTATDNPFLRKQTLKRK